MATSFDFSKNKIPAKYKQNQSSKKAGVGELEYDDKRGESVAQLKLQEAANKSSSVRGLEDINNQANNSDNVTQLMSLQNTINEPQTQEETIQNQESPYQLKSSNDSVLQMAKPELKKQNASNDLNRDNVYSAAKLKSAGADQEEAEAKANVGGARKKKLAELKKIGMETEEQKQGIRDKRKEQKSTVDGTGGGSNVSTTDPTEIHDLKKANSDLTLVKDDQETIQWITKLAREAGAAGREDAWFTDKDGKKFYQYKEITNWDASNAKKLRIPHWRDYLTNAYVYKHLAKFAGGGHAFVPMEAHKKVMGLHLKVDFGGWGNKDQFITPIDEANVLSDDAQKDEGIKTLEKVCGLPEASWAANADKKVARYFVPSTTILPPKSEEEAKFQVQMVTGQEYGAHVDFWNAGGITSGGLSEAKIKAVPRETLLLKISQNEIIQDIETYKKTPDLDGSGKYIEKKQKK